MPELPWGYSVDARLLISELYISEWLKMEPRSKLATDLIKTCSPVRI